MAGTKSVFFGPSPKQPYDNGEAPCCAINSKNRVVTIHEGTFRTSLNWRLGMTFGANLSFFLAPDQHDFDTGYDPSVALTNDDVVVEVHGSRRSTSGYLFYHVGEIKDHEISFPTGALQVGKDQGSDPSVALDQKNHVVEVHVGTKGQLRYRVGQLRPDLFKVEWWESARDLPPAGGAVGDYPSVAMNGLGQLVVVYANAETLHYVRGQLSGDGTDITWKEVRPYIFRAPTKGSNPSVALTDDGYVYEVHQSSTGLYQRIGHLDPGDDKAITWTAFFDRERLDLRQERLDVEFDSGQLVQIATNGKAAIQVHQTESTASKGLFANASLSFDHANWMGDNRQRLLSRTLRDLVLPGSHDSGAYLDDTLPQRRAQTQSLTIYGQLAAGTRYFDLRPKYTGDPDQPFDATKLYTYHGPINGPLFTTVLKSVHDFMTDHKELVILKISHYNNFNQKVFDGMADLISGGGGDPGAALKPWLFTGDVATKRLAERPMTDFLLPDRGTVLVVVDSDGQHNPDNRPADREYLPNPRRSGFYRYRDWYATDPQAGDLTVFDLYSDTTDFYSMSEGPCNDPDRPRAVRRDGTPLPQGQLPKFREFNGVCRNQYEDQGVKKDWPCDLFLLSWTLTPRPGDLGGALALSRIPNQELCNSLIPVKENPSGRVINVVYTDAVQNSRSADLALLRNRL